jgi:hypothetical protein
VKTWFQSLLSQILNLYRYAAFMREHHAQFDDHFVRRKMWDRVGIDESEWGGDALVGRAG